jgi:hypothetical protein
MALSRTSFPERMTMTQRSRATWRATTTPHVPTIDAVEAALDRDAAELSYRTCSFAFAKTRRDGGHLLLTLTPSGSEDGAEALGHRPAEQLVPAVPGDLTPLARERIEARFVHVFGRALFADVARMIDVDRKFR